MALKSRFKVENPKVSVPSWLFGSPSHDLPKTPIVLDPLEPETRFLTLSSYRRHAQRFAAGLRSAGFQTGDHLLYVSGNSMAFYVVYMGTLMAGGIFSGANALAPAEQIAYLAEDSGCKFLLASSVAYEKCVEALKGVSIAAKHVYLVDREALFGAPSRNPPAGPHHDWIELLGEPSQGLNFDWDEYCTDPEQLATLNYTSGSTGPPKGVMTSHRNQVANSTQWMFMNSDDSEEPQKTRSAIWVGWLPMVYVFGQTQFLLTCPKRGIPNYLMESFDLDSMIKLMEKYRATQLVAIPAIVIALVNSKVAQEADLTCINSVGIGGAPIKRPLCERLEKLLGNPDLVVKPGWGMTEVTCIAIGWHPLDNTRSTAVGELLPNCEGKILSIDGTKELGPNQKGELLIRAPTVTQGYWKKAEQTKAAYQSDDWLRTGDLAYYDEQERWYVIDRLRELIVTSEGHQIVPSEVESVLLDIRGVTDAGVASVDVDGQSTRAPRAFVVLDPSFNLTTEAVQKILVEKLDATQQMTAGIYELDEIPKLLGGKVNRIALRSLVV